MSFTNDDLKRIKELDCGASTTIGSDDLRALLARLEAAEHCAEYLDAIHESDRAPVENDALNQWRKAAGK